MFKATEGLDTDWDLLEMTRDQYVAQRNRRLALSGIDVLIMILVIGIIIIKWA